MPLLELEICNFGPHRQFSRAFGPGLTGVIGPNGSGKSTLLDAVRYLLGGARFLPDKKDACICDQAGPKEKSFVRGRFAHHEHTFQVTRWLRPASPTAELAYETDKRLTGDEKVTEKIEEILGQRIDIIVEASMVEQLRLFAFLHDQPAKRREYFQKLLGLDRAAVLYDAITVKRRQTVVPDYVAELAAASSRLVELNAAAQEAAAQLAAIPEEGVLRQQYDAATSQVAAIAAAETRRQTQAELDFAERELHNAVLEGNAAGANLVRAEQREAAAAASMAAASQGDAVRMAAARRRELEARLAELQGGVRQWEDIPIPPRYAEAATIEKRYADLSETYGRLNDLVTAFAGDRQECPTCHAPLAARQVEVAEAQIAIPPLLQEIAGLHADCQAFSHYRQVQAQRPDAVARLQSSIAQTRERLAELPPDAEIPVTDLAAARRVHAEAVAVLEQCRRASQVASSDAARLQGRVEALRRTLASLPTVPVGQDAAAAREERDRVFSLLQRRQQLSATAATVAASLPAAIAAVDKLAGLQQTAQRKKEWVSRLDEMASPLHSTAAPAKMALDRLAAISQIVNSFLGHLRMPFQAAFDESLTFTAIFPDGTTRKRLSPGQMVAVAVATRFALNIVVAGIGVLYLDEPTVYLDAARVQAFEAVLAGLRQYVSAQGLQCLLITHAATLAPLFDDVVRLA